MARLYIFSMPLLQKMGRIDDEKEANLEFRQPNLAGEPES